MKQSDGNRGKQLTAALLLIDWLQQRRCPFRVQEIIELLEIHRRGAYRWLTAARNLGWVACEKELSDHDRPSWKSQLYKTPSRPR